MTDGYLNQLLNMMLENIWIMHKILNIVTLLEELWLFLKDVITLSIFGSHYLVESLIPTRLFSEEFSPRSYL